MERRIRLAKRHGRFGRIAAKYEAKPQRTDGRPKNGLQASEIACSQTQALAQGQPCNDYEG